MSDITEGDTQRQIRTDGGAYVEGSISTDTGDVVGRDLIMHGNRVTIHNYYRSDRRGTPTPTKPPYIVRRLPSHFLERPDELKALRQLVLGSDGVAKAGFTAIQGMGGAGKTVLAAALCHDPEIMRVFRDGIVWVNIGRELKDIVGKMQAIGVAFKDELHYYTNPDTCFSKLCELLADKAVLIVLNDVAKTEHVRSFLFDAPQCHIVLTTREQQVADSVSASNLRLGSLSPSDAVKMLELVSGTESPELAEIASRLGYLPLALELAGKLLRSGRMTPTEWPERFREHVSKLRLTPGSTKPDESIHACLDFSVNQLQDHQASLYYALGVFPEDVWVPQRLVLMLWHRLRPELAESELVELVEWLANLSLIDLEEESVSLHDLLHDYNRIKLEERNLLAQCHRALLAGYRPGPRPWYKAPHDSYLYAHLPYHLIHAGRKQALFRLLAATAGWMERTCTKADLLREIFLIGIWRTCWDTDPKRSGRFLTKRWLRRWGALGKRKGYTARVIAVRCAFESGCDAGLAVALSHPDRRLRLAARNYMYALSKQKPQRAVRVMKAVGARVKRGIVPNLTALRSVFLLAPLMAIDQYQDEQSDASVIQQVLAVLRESIRYVMQESPLRILGLAGQSQVRKIGVEMLTHLTSSIKTTSINGAAGLSLFFDKPPEVRQQTIDVLPFLNREHPHPEQVPEIVQGIFGRTNDRVSHLVADYVLCCHGIRRPALAESALRQLVSAIDDGGCVVLLYAVHNWYSIMDRRPDGDITDATLNTMREFVEEWMASDTCRQHGYGTVYHNGQAFPYYPLAYYAALWTKTHRGEQVDLLEQFAEQADGGDQALKLHIIDTFRDSRQVLHDYPTVLGILAPYVKELPQDDIGEDERKAPTWQHLVESLGMLYNAQPNHVDAFLDQASAPLELIEDIHWYSYANPSSDLYMRVFQFLVDVLAYAPIPFVEQLIEILRQALSTESFGEMAIVLVSSLLELAKPDEESALNE